MDKPDALWQKQGSPMEHKPEPADPEKERRHRKGIIWILSPIISLPIVLSLYAIFRFVASKALTEATVSGGGLAETSTLVVVARVVSVLLSLIPIILIPLGIIMGLYYFLKK